MKDENGAKPASSTGKRKQAVIVIHGMGEQIPKQALRSLVEATWITDGDAPTHCGDGSGGVTFWPDGCCRLWGVDVSRPATRKP